MDPSVHFLLGSDVQEPEGATIHPIAPPAPPEIDDDKIGFTLDVAMRLEKDPVPEDAEPGVVIPISENVAEDLADTA